MLRVIGINDFHGALEPRADPAGVMRGGAAYLAASVHAAEAECVPPACESVVLDAGDEFQGTPASNLAFGRPVVTIFEKLGVAAAALGNHEFDWGQDTLRARMRQAHYDILGANVRTGDGTDVAWIRDDTIVMRGGIHLGVIGVSTVQTPTSTRPSNVAGLHFDDPAPIVDSLTRELRARGVDAVIVLAHAGAYCDRGGAAACQGEVIDLARRLTSHVDAIVSGHTHSLVNTAVNGVPVVQARSSGTAIDVLDLPIGAGDDDLSEARHEVRDVRPDAIAPDSAVLAIVRQATRAVAPLVDRPVARVSEDMPKFAGDEQSALGNLLADAMRVVGKGDVAVMNNGGIRAPLRAGTATYGALFEIQPFANTLYRVSVRGRDLRQYLERIVDHRRPAVHVSGIVVTYDSTRPPGTRLLSVRLRGGMPLDDAKTYTVVLNDFEYAGGGNLGFGDAALRATPLDIVDLDALVRYLRSLPPPVRAPNDVRFVAAGAPPTQH